MPSLPPPCPFQRLGIVGTGLLGTSVALAARRAGCGTVVGFDRNSHHVETALKRGALTAAARTLDDVCRNSDLVVLAVPVGVAVRLLPEIAATASDCLLTDTGSTKRQIIDAATTAGLADRLCAAHPMAGSERSGPEAADAGLFDGATCYTFGSADETMRQVTVFWESLGCCCKPSLSPEDHDRVMSQISHMPHAVAAAVVSAAGDAVSAAGRGFEDATRIAAGDADLWADILLSNADFVRMDLQRVREVLEALETSLAQGDRDSVRAILTSAAERRRGIRSTYRNDKAPARLERGPCS